METAALALTSETLPDEARAERRGKPAWPRWVALAVSVVLHGAVIAAAIWLIRTEPVPEQPVPVEIVMEDDGQVADADRPAEAPPQERAFEIRPPNLAGGEVAEQQAAPEPAAEPPVAPSPEVAPPQPASGAFTFLPQQLPGLEQFTEPLPRQEAAVPVPTPPRARANLPVAPEGPRITQTTADFIRAQILSNLLINWRDRRYRGASIEIQLELRADGTFAPPYNRADAWNPRAMIRDYDRLLERGSEDIRVLLEGIARALRAAQPLQLPPGQHRYPMQLNLSFRAG